MASILSMKTTSRGFSRPVCLYVISLNEEQVKCACTYKPKSSNLYSKPEWLHEYNDGKEYTPSYNIAPTDVTPVLISAAKFKNAVQTERVLKPMMWGIIPPWHKGNYRNHNLSTNNCRLEGMQGSKLYNPILQKGGRCVIVVEGFYEWQTTIKSKSKQPYYIYAPQDSDVKIDEPGSWNNSFNEKDGWKGVKLLHMAGLYNVWQNEDVIMYSYSVITMDSNSTLDWLHHRMPAILDNDQQIDAWLNITEVDPHMALAYLKPVKILSWHPVATLVNNARNKSVDCNRRITLDTKVKSSQKTLTGWFIKAEKRKSIGETSSESKRQHQSE